MRGVRGFSGSVRGAGRARGRVRSEGSQGRGLGVRCKPRSFVRERLYCLLIDLSSVSDTKGFSSSLDVDGEHLHQTSYHLTLVEGTGKTYLKLFFWQYSCSGSVVYGHGMSGQPMFFFQLGIQ